MKKTRYIFFLLTIAHCLASDFSFAQQVFLSNQHIVNKASLSPAYTGFGDNVGVFGSYRKDWIGVAGAPESKIISANGTLFKNMGIGGSVTAQQAGIFTNLSAMLNYAYHVKFSESCFLSIGLGFGILERHLDLSNGDAIDPVINNMDRTSSMADASIGALFHYKNLNFGFGSPRVTNKKSDKSFIWSNRRVHLSYKCSFSKSWAIEPIVIYYPKQPMFAEIVVPIIYQQKVWLSLIYKETSAGLGIGANVKSNIVFNYTFEWYEHGLAHRSGGTHEITLGWKFLKNKTNLPKPDNKKPYYEWINK